VLLRSLRKAGQCEDPGTSITNYRSPVPDAAGWQQGVLLPLLPLDVLVKRVLDRLLVLFYGGEPVFETGVLHLLLMIAHGLVMVAIGREGHTSSLMVTQDFFILLLLIVVEIVILPLPT
jgi:hypothetical protein